MFKKIGVFFMLVGMITGCGTGYKSFKKSVSYQPFFDHSKILIRLLDSSRSPFDLRASEPSVSINRQNRDWIMAGSILDNYYFSKDGGENWEKGRLTSKYGVFGDPVLFSDPEGNFYYFHLALKNQEFLRAIIVQKTSDGGKHWTDVAIGENPPKQQDKPWVGYEPVSQTLAVSWTEFDRYGSKNPEDKSRILVSFSNDKAENWTKPVKINDLDGDCLDDDQTVEGAVPVFIDKDTVLVVWAYDRKIWFDKSVDGGRTWGKDQVIARQEAGWAFDFPGIYRANGLSVFLRDTVSGTLLVLFGDKDPGGQIKFTLSTDQGKTWQPVKVLPLHGDQFFPASVILHGYGRFAVLHYERNGTDSLSTEVKLSLYDFEGQLHDSITLTQSPFKPDKRIFFGDYIDLDFDGQSVAAVWTEIRQYKTRCMFAKVPVKFEK